MNELQIFNNPDFGKIRAIERDGEPWFVGKDVARALGYKDTINALKAHVDAEDKAGWRITTQFGEKETTIINESGVYSLIFSSKLEKAREFKRWVTAEVLPAIRKTGGYLTPQAKEQLAALTQAQAEQAKTQAALIESVQALAQKVEALEDSHPTVVYAKDPPLVSLAGLAKLAIHTRRVMLDMGSTPEQIGEVTRSMLNTCGFNLPSFKKENLVFLKLSDFF